MTFRLPDLLRTYRERASLTQDEAAEKLKIGRSTLVRYENRRSSPPFDVLHSLLDAYGITWHQLADDLEPDAAHERDTSGADERLVRTLLDTIEMLKSSGS